MITNPPLLLTYTPSPKVDLAVLANPYYNGSYDADAVTRRCEEFLKGFIYDAFLPFKVQEKT